MVSEDFLIVREEWNQYRILPDNAPLRVRISVLSVNAVGDKVSVEVAQIIKRPPLNTEDKGPPSADQSITDQDILENLKFEKDFESLNIYDLPKLRKIVLCKPTLKTLATTKKFDSKGNRLYQFGFQLAIAPIDYPPENPSTPSISPPSEEDH